MFPAASATFIEDENRPSYERAARLGGKKRKHNYNKRQPWRR